MSSPINFSYSASLPHGSAPSSGPSTATRPLPTPEAEHAAAIPIVAALMQSIYDLSGELRGMGPIAHQAVREQGKTALNQRLTAALKQIEDVHRELAALRGPVIYRQLQQLGIDEQSRDLQLHIGCGGHHLPGWINLDNYPAPLAVNLEWGLPLPSASSKFVFLSHLLEHLFHPTQSHRLLDEIHRVLQPGGVVRIVVPDIEQCINAYARNDETFFSDRRKHWTWLPKDMTRLESFLAYAGVGPAPEHLFEHHKFGYDFETLHRCLERVGFVNIRRCAFQASPHAALRVDHASSNASAQHEGGHYSLFVEAESPSLCALSVGS